MFRTKTGGILCLKITKKELQIYLNGVWPLAVSV